MSYKPLHSRNGRTQPNQEEIMETPIPQPVPKHIQGKFVQAEQDLMWLSEHGMLDMTARFLAALRRDTEATELIEEREVTTFHDGGDSAFGGVVTAIGGQHKAWDGDKTNHFETDGVTHLSPGVGSNVTPCCDKSLFDLPVTDRVTLHQELVTCNQPAAAEETAESGESAPEGLAEHPRQAP